MLSFFRRTPSAAPDSSNRDPKPPPSPGKRQQKEKAWLHSISSKSSRSGSSAQPASTRNTAPRRSDKAASNVAQQGFKPAPSLRPQPSSASLKSSATRRSFFGIKGKSSTEPAAEDQDRRRPTSTYAASAPSHLGASRSHSPPPPLPPSLPPPTTTDTTTKSLATRLQELSIANADGLLDDEEYRMLRTRLFETYATGAAGGDQENKSLLVEGREAVPRLGGGSNGASTSSELSSDAGPQHRKTALTCSQCASKQPFELQHHPTPLLPPLRNPIAPLRSFRPPPPADLPSTTSSAEAAPPSPTARRDPPRPSQTTGISSPKRPTPTEATLTACCQGGVGGDSALEEREGRGY